MIKIDSFVQWLTIFDLVNLRFSYEELDNFQVIIAIESISNWWVWEYNAEVSGVLLVLNIWWTSNIKILLLSLLNLLERYNSSTIKTNTLVEYDTSYFNSVISSLKLIDHYIFL